MNDELIKTENISVESEKPVQVPLEDNVKFPPFPEPRDVDFEVDISEKERDHYKIKFKDLNAVTTYRIHCTACDRHLGCSARSENRLCPHPMLRTLMCHTCHTFYNSGEFEKGDDGSELYCRWCGQGGQVYCCSACPHVFCAKCIKRNLGMAMIKEIEETDDWKCFNCNTKYLWDLRALCWAVLRYCDLKNRITYATQDPTLKQAYEEDCTLDLTVCCRSRTRRKTEEKKPKKELKEDVKKNISSTPLKAPSTIQVKKFASINVEEAIIKADKKTQKRPASPKNKPIIIKNSMTMGSKVLTPVIMPSMAKKMRMANAGSINPIRFSNDRKQVNSYTRIRPQTPLQQMMFNGYGNNTPFNHMVVSDNINLSLESLTQGLDMATVAGIANNPQENDVVCTPDFPLEPLCEVTEDTNDDDVQCIGPVVAPKAPPPLPPPPLIPRNIPNSITNLSTDNIIQMTENDVTVNAVTGGLKFRVDPQTLSSNKMYRLPDGRIFAINANPSMPGGYSATIVAVTDDAVSKMAPKGATYAAKLSSVGNQIHTPPSSKEFRNQTNNKHKPKHTPKTLKSKTTVTPTRDCDLNVSIEWFRYNVIDAVDSLEYSLSRLTKLKQECTTKYLRTRSVSEMRNLQKKLDRLLNTSTCRFNEIRENLNKEFKDYRMKKMSGNTSDDDDDVEILHDDLDDPIFIDENSVESNLNESQEVDLTVLGSSDHNDSSEKSLDKNDCVQILDPVCLIGHQDSCNNASSLQSDKTVHDEVSEKLNDSIQKPSVLQDNPNVLEEKENQVSEKQNVEIHSHDSTKCNDNDNTYGETEQTGKNVDNMVSKNTEMELSDVNGEEGDDTNQSHMKGESSMENEKGEDISKDDRAGQSHNDKKTDDSETNKEIIENLLKDDPGDEIVKESLTVKDVPA